MIPTSDWIFTRYNIFVHESKLFTVKFTVRKYVRELACQVVCLGMWADKARSHHVRTRLRFTVYRLPSTGYCYQITVYGSQITDYSQQITVNRLQCPDYYNKSR